MDARWCFVKALLLPREFFPAMGFQDSTMKYLSRSLMTSQVRPSSDIWTCLCNSEDLYDKTYIFTTRHFSLRQDIYLYDKTYGRTHHSYCQTMTQKHYTTVRYTTDSRLHYPRIWHMCCNDIEKWQISSQSWDWKCRWGRELRALTAKLNIDLMLECACFACSAGGRWVRWRARGAGRWAGVARWPIIIPVCLRLLIVVLAFSLFLSLLRIFLLLLCFLFLPLLFLVAVLLSILSGRLLGLLCFLLQFFPSRLAS